MADSDALKEGVNKEVLDWTLALYTYLLEHINDDKCTCEVDGVNYDLAISSLIDGGEQFVSMADEAGDQEQIFFFAKEDHDRMNTFYGSEDNGLGLLQKVCNKLQIKLDPAIVAARKNAKKATDVLTKE